MWSTQQKLLASTQPKMFVHQKKDANPPILSLSEPKPASEIVPEYVKKSIGGDKNGGKRLVPTPNAPHFYPAEDVRKPKKKMQIPPSSLSPNLSLLPK